MELSINSYTNIENKYCNRLGDHLDFDVYVDGIDEVLEYIHEALDYIIDENAIKFDEGLDQVAQDILDYVILKNHIELPEHASITEFMIMSNTEIGIHAGWSLYKHFNNMYECYQWLNDTAAAELASAL